MTSHFGTLWRKMTTAVATSYSGYNDSFMGQNRTPIHFAAFQGQLHALYGLIKLGKNVNSRTVDGVTPLHEACSKGNFYCAKMLIKAGAQVNARNVDGSTPLCDAACSGDLSCINLLLENGAHVNDPLARSTPLHEAALRDNSAAVSALIGVGAELELSDGHFGTPLHAACFRASVASAIVLLLAGANVNATKLHESPLHMAASVGNAKLVQVLIDFGADINQLDNSGKKPVDRAKPQSDAFTLLKYYESNPRSLEDACRLTVYKNLKLRQAKDLVYVGLPVPIVDRLLCRGLWAP